MAEQRIIFNRKNLADFQPTLRKRVNDYFKDNNISRNANSLMIFKTVVILLVYATTYALALSNILSPWALLGVVLLHGFATALIGLNIAHDAIHGAYSSSPKVNKFLGALFNVIGANDYNWSISHNMVHHTFTNIPDHDGDIDQVPVIRTNPNQDLWKMHRFQHVYIFFLYMLSSLSWVMMKDYVILSKDKVGGLTKPKTPTKEIIRLFGYKLVYYTLFLIIPILVINLPWYMIVLGFVLMHLVEGLTLALIFQVSHIIEGVSFLKPDEKGVMENSWAAHQVLTSANYGMNSPTVVFLTGGLNFQIEHHLFPNICHIHYPNIAPIVKQTAEEFGLRYVEYKTFMDALRSHARTLKRFGTEKEYVGY